MGDGQRRERSAPPTQALDVRLAAVCQSDHPPASQDPEHPPRTMSSLVRGSRAFDHWGRKPRHQSAQMGVGETCGEGLPQRGAARKRRELAAAW